MSKRAHENGDRFDDEEAGSLWTLKTVRHAGAAGWWYCYRLSRFLARSPELAAARGIATAARSTKATMTGSAGPQPELAREDRPCAGLPGQDQHQHRWRITGHRPAGPEGL